LREVSEKGKKMNGIFLKQKSDKRFYNGKKYIDEKGNIYNWQMVKINFIKKGIPTVIKTY
jgi:hypothetical protein